LSGGGTGKTGNPKKSLVGMQKKERGLETALRGGGGWEKEGVLP